MKRIISFVILICLFLSVSAITIDAPEEVIINEKEEYFIVEITNDSRENRDIKINFFTPTTTQISAPKYIPADSKITAKIFVKNLNQKQEIRSKLEVISEEEKREKYIILKFNPVEQSNQGAMSGLFGLTTLFEQTTQLSSLEYVLLFTLIFIIIILLAIFVIRLGKRGL